MRAGSSHASHRSGGSTSGILGWISASDRGPGSSAGCGCAKGSGSASVVSTEHVAHHAWGWSPGSVGSRQNSYIPAMAITEPSAGVTKYGCLRVRFLRPCSSSSRSCAPVTHS
ncbi:hypothetical protein GCM10020000_27070 [Streptomyces olivoverticillatus]